MEFKWYDKAVLRLEAEFIPDYQLNGFDVNILSTIHAKVKKPISFIKPVPNKPTFLLWNED